MAREYLFEFPLFNGLHARPASHLEELARAFHAVMTFVNERNDRRANLRNVLELISTDTSQTDPCRIVVEGLDEDSAFTALTACLKNGFLHCDEALPVESAHFSGAAPFPRSLREAGLTQFLSGTIASRGIGWGRVVTLNGFVFPAALNDEIGADPTSKLARFTGAIAALLDDYTRAQPAAHPTESAVLKAHASMLRDGAFSEAVAAGLRDGVSLSSAIAAALQTTAAQLREARNPVLRERVGDLEDIGARLLEKIYGISSAARLPVLVGPSILMAESLTPGQLLALDRKHLQGLVLSRASETSHTIILARSFSIPVLTGVKEFAGAVRSGIEVIVDANVGIVVTALSAGVRHYYDNELARAAQIRERNALVAGRPATTADGRRLSVAANVASAGEVVAAVAQGAEGIGLFRTELLFTGCTIAPSEDEQFAIYAEAVRAAAPHPIVFRTLDVGGDKSVPFLDLQPEENPFLGYRGVRLYEQHAALLKTQMRAILRCAAYGPLRVMIPMVATVDEVRLARRLLDEAAEELSGDLQGHARGVLFGVMIEVPSAAFLVGDLCKHAEFFSLGTNDLAQYFFAADRTNTRVASRYSAFDPSFLRFLKQIVATVHVQGRTIGMCGEMAEDRRGLPLLVGLGLDNISMAAPRIAATKAALGKLRTFECAALLDTAMGCATADEVARMLALAQERALPLLTPELVILDVAARSKAEVIHVMVEGLHRAGRTEAPTDVEEAVWRREDVYSTGFGDGFALPHCKCDTVNLASIVVARMREPVEWHALDGQPVDVAILLAIQPEERGRVHLKTLAVLSRRLMQPEFRAFLRSEADPARLAATFLQQISPSETTPAN